MKKQFLILGGLILIASNLQAVTANEVLQKFNVGFGTLFGQGYLFNKAIATQQNQTIDQWYTAINTAKTFVTENCKNIAGIKDSDLLNAMATIEKENMNLMNAIKIARGSTPQGQASIFANIESNMKNLASRIGKISYTLSPNKKEAQRIIVAVATYLESGANKAGKDIKNPPAPTDLPPTLPR